jgi:hypothetical protein
MRIGRAVVIPAIVALGVAGSALASTAVPAAAGHVTNVRVLAQSYVPGPDVFLYI